MPKIGIFCALALTAMLPNAASALLMRHYTYPELFSSADMVVIATPITETADTHEKPAESGFGQQLENGKMEPILFKGGKTEFSVNLVMKGDTDLKTFVLHTMGDMSEIMGLGEEISKPVESMHFDPSDISQRSSYLLFLKQDKNGWYKPANESAGDAPWISKVPFDADKETLDHLNKMIDNSKSANVKVYLE